jgi:AefR-like transcriptional repressor, C-terminal domain
MALSGCCGRLPLSFNYSIIVCARAEKDCPKTFPGVAKVLGAQGRDSIVPKLARYLESQRAQGRLEFEDAGTAVDALIGLAIGDQQVRRLLGVLPMPEPEQIGSRAERAVRSFLTLFGRKRSAL